MKQWPTRPSQEDGAPVFWGGTRPSSRFGTLGRSSGLDVATQQQCLPLPSRGGAHRSSGSSLGQEYQRPSQVINGCTGGVFS
jgi:hypothetical protein